MTNRHPRLRWPIRVLVVVAALLVLGGLRYALWHYYFEAPQYPEGLAMEIWGNRLAGRVDLINNLNHYVGFMPLHQEDFFEFKVLPIALIAIAVLGILAAFRGTRRALLAWIALYGAFGVLALIDFYRWLHKFGTTVDPNAIITVDGYTPPMFGTSQFMNFYITSYPGTAAYLLVAAAGIGILALILSFIFKPKHLAKTAVTGKAQSATLEAQHSQKGRV